MTGGNSGCQCGGCLAAAPILRSRRSGITDAASIDARLADALLSAKATEGATRREWDIHYAGDCQDPLTVRQESIVSCSTTRARLDKALRFSVRCRKCKACRRAKQNYWGFAAMNMTLQTQERGLRTWFGTLLWSQPERDAMEERCREKARSNPSGPQADWNNPECDTRFAMLREECLKDVQRFWKRLRKAGHIFKYLVVFERHRAEYGAWPHAHFLLHEQEKPIRKRVLQGQWPHGFSNVSIVGGKSKNAAAPNRAAWYVVKYLSKSDQSRLVASAGYRPQRRAGASVPLRPRILRPSVPSPDKE